MDGFLGYLVMYTILHLVCSGIMAKYFFEVAGMKGYEGDRYYWLPFLFTFAGYLLIIALPDRSNENFSKSNSPQQSKRDELPDI